MHFRKQIKDIRCVGQFTCVIFVARWSKWETNDK